MFRTGPSVEDLRALSVIFVFLSSALRPVTVFRTGPVWPLEDIEALSEHEEGGRHYPYLTTYNLPWDHYIFFGSL